MGHEVEELHREDREHDRDQHRRQFGHQPLQREDHHEGDDPDGERRDHRVPVNDALHELHGLVHEAVPLDGEAEELRELSHDDREGEPVHVSDLGRL